MLAVWEEWKQIRGAEISTYVLRSSHTPKEKWRRWNHSSAYVVKGTDVALSLV
jgi:hypothetical protein